VSSREIVILGTASQVPTRARNHNAAFLFWDDLGILFDPGEGTQRQMTHAGLAASQITHIAITHFHGDHCLGLASMIQRISLDRVAHPVEIFYPASGQQYFERLRWASIYHDQANVVPRPHSGGELQRVGTARLSAARLDHGVECYGYRLDEDDGRRMLPDALEQAGVRGAAIKELTQKGSIELDGRVVKLEDVSVPRPGQAVAYVMDTRPCAGAEKLAHGVDLLVCESTYLASETAEADAHRHMSAEQAGALARGAGVRRLVLTHFSQRYGASEPFAAEARRLHSDVFAVDDLQRVPVPKRR
jgi:ribonuclease Z